MIEGELEPGMAALPGSDLDYGSAHLDRIEDANLRADIDAEAEQLDRISQSAPG